MQLLCIRIRTTGRNNLCIVIYTVHYQRIYLTHLERECDSLPQLVGRPFPKLLILEPGYDIQA